MSWLIGILVLTTVIGIAIGAAGTALVLRCAGRWPFSHTVKRTYHTVTGLGCPWRARGRSYRRIEWPTSATEVATSAAASTAADHRLGSADRPLRGSADRR
jgi:hypothetical protein